MVAHIAPSRFSSRSDFETRLEFSRYHGDFGGLEALRTRRFEQRNNQSCVYFRQMYSWRFFFLSCHVFCWIKKQKSKPILNGSCVGCDWLDCFSLARVEPRFVICLSPYTVCMLSCHISLTYVDRATSCVGVMYASLSVAPVLYAGDRV